MTAGTHHARRFRSRYSGPDIAIVGGGVAGLACARRLVESGFLVAVFDKGRRPGGRVATRRAEGFVFDHGAQYFTAETDPFRAEIDTARRSGEIAPWGGKIVTLSDGTVETITDDHRRWVGVPGMSTLVHHLAAGLDIRCGHSVADIVREGEVWRLVAEGGSTLAGVDLVVVAIPAPQAFSLLAVSPDMAGRVTAATFSPCWAVMLGFDEPMSLPFDGAFVGNGPLAWISRNRSSPGRGGGEAWVLHASPSWSREHLEVDRRAVSEDLQRAFRLAASREPPRHAYAAAHRWRYARVETSVGEACLFDPDLRIGACGDWCIGGKIEAAFASGRALADRIVADLGSVGPTNRLDEKE